MARTATFYIPNIAMWNWRLVSPAFVKVQMERAKLSMAETDNALDILDADVMKIQQEIKGVWANASVQMMRAFEDRLKEVGRERKRIMFVRMRLREVIDRMSTHLMSPASFV
jgi:uncharacterized Zn finger protein